MGYQALLFCPDEKTARTVTQVLSELEFNVESCIEPFAAVKKLMGAHFDAIVVDCDNEQNATLLFKSARNTASNQASLAVAVVEGQAGVAKAFRIGANLVLTKPINIEQAKGTLRVARGLLRKGEPGKPAAAPAATATPSPKPTPKLVSPVKPAAPAAPSALATPRPIAPPVMKPPAINPPAQAAVASSSFAVQDPDDVLPEILADEPATPTMAAAATSAPVVPMAKLPAAKPATESKPASRSAVPTMGSGAASAPAPARQIEPPQIAESPTPKADAIVEKPAEASVSAPGLVGSAPSFTFGGANLPAESSAGRTKILIGIAAAILVGAALYFGWTYFQGRSSQPVRSQIGATMPAPQPVKPANPQPAASSNPSLPLPSSQPAAQTRAADASPSPITDPHADIDESPAETDTPHTTSISPKTSASSASKTETAAKSEPAPLVVRGGKVPAVHPKAEATDAPAPSMIGIAVPGSSAPPPNLVSAESSAPRLAPQTVNISQGVSQGLLIKKVQPVYPRTALSLRVEGAVQLMATISKTGEITTVKVLSGDPQLSRSAVEAVKQWKYKPYLLNGEPVEIQTQVTINFKLPD